MGSPRRSRWAYSFNRRKARSMCTRGDCFTETTCKDRVSIRRLTAYKGCPGTAFMARTYVPTPTKRRRRTTVKAVERGASVRRGTNPLTTSHTRCHEDEDR